MPRFAANLTLLFTERPFLDRFDAARRAGFRGVEMLFPYDHAPAEIRRALDDCGLPLVLFNTPPGDWDAGERGFAACPGAEARLAETLDLALDYAAALRPRHLHVMAGLAAGSEARACFVANLRRLTARAPGRSFVIEPINPHDMPGYFLQDFATARAILREVGAPNLGLQFDAYHAHRITDDLLAAWDEHAGLVRHVQIAGHPGRHEPIPSDLPARAFFARLDAGGYRGFVSGEYHPRGRTEDGLSWIAP